jgi:hypothetical protein
MYATHAVGALENLPYVIVPSYLSSSNLFYTINSDCVFDIINKPSAIALSLGLFCGFAPRRARFAVPVGLFVRFPLA